MLCRCRGCPKAPPASSPAPAPLQPQPPYTACRRWGGARVVVTVGEPEFLRKIECYTPRHTVAGTSDAVSGATEAVDSHASPPRSSTPRGAQRPVLGADRAVGTKQCRKYHRRSAVRIIASGSRSGGLFGTATEPKSNGSCARMRTPSGSATCRPTAKRTRPSTWRRATTAWRSWSCSWRPAEVCRFAMPWARRRCTAYVAHPPRAGAHRTRRHPV